MSTEAQYTPDERAEAFIELLDRGLSYAQVASRTGNTSNAVRNSIRRYNQRNFGEYGGYRSVANPKPLLVPISTEGYAADRGERVLQEPAEPLEIWNVDIERFPRIEYSWSAKKYSKFTPETFLVEDGRMVSFAAKQLGGPTIFSSEFHHGRENMLQSIWHVMDRATIVVGWNSKRFDIPHIDGAFRDAGLPVYRPVKQIDLFQAVRSRFNYDYNTMKSVAARWGLAEQKMDNEGFDLWKRCMANDPEAWETMKQYNMQDVRTGEAAYLDNLQWLTGSIPNLGLWANAAGGMACPACAEEDVYEDGTAPTGVSLFKAYRCRRCGYRSRSNEKVASTNLRPIAR